MTVESFGVQTVQAVATVLAAAIVLLAAVLLALELIGEQKYRIWHIYMAGSAYAFEHNWMALFQILGGRPHCDGTQDYPFNRRHVYGA